MTDLYEKDYLVCNLPNKSKLHFVQFHVVQKFMDITILRVWKKCKLDPKKLFGFIVGEKGEQQ